MQSTSEPTSRKGHAGAGAPVDSVKSDLLELCFPKSAPEADVIRRLAYANSICLVFLALAVVGIKTPVFVIKAPKVVEPAIPIVFEPPPQQQVPSVTPQPNNDLPEPEPDMIVDTPQVAAVVVADLADVAFSIPVEGPVILTPAKYAAPPPRVLPPPAPVVVSQPGPPQPVEFDSGINDGGIYPDPDYPVAALRRRMEGRVMLYVVVDETGSPQSIEVRDTSGWPVLDNHALSFVKRRWHWPSGGERHYLIPFRFQLSKN